MTWRLGCTPACGFARSERHWQGLARAPVAAGALRWARLPVEQAARCVPMAHARLQAAARLNQTQPEGAWSAMQTPLAWGHATYWDDTRGYGSPKQQIASPACSHVRTTFHGE